MPLHLPSFTSTWHRGLPRAIAAALVAVLVACGGGGGGGGSSGGSSGGDSSGTLQLNGIAATGAPLSGATVRVLDASGQSVTLLDAAGASTTTATTSVGDGAFRLTLATAQPSLPLLLQVRGIDAVGMPVVLHSALTTMTAPVTAHVTPFTDAIVGMVMGAPPQTVFAAGTAGATSIAKLASATAMSGASDQLKSIAKANFTDAGYSDTKLLDLFKDTTLSTDKTGQDVAIESLRLQYAKDTAGKDQLLLAHKFLSPKTVEIRVDLATAATELAKTTGGTPASAIVSTLKVTSSPTTVLGTLASLEAVSAGLNQLIARGAPAADFLASTWLPTTYTRHNGRTRAQLADLLASYALTNVQIGKWQLVGCADDPVAAKTCTRVVVAALVTNQAGEIVDVLTDAVTYVRPAAPAVAGWRLAGNNLGASVQVVPVATLTLNATLTAVASTVANPNPGSGVQVLARALDFATPPAAAIDQLFVQLPTGFSVRLASCGQTYLCMAPSAATPAVATDGLQDSLIQPTTTGWLSSVDAVRGARYTASYALLATPTATLTQPALLSADVPSGAATTRFAVPDVVTGQPLDAAALEAGTTLRWAAWSTAQADMKLVLVRNVLRHGDPADATATPLVQVVDAALPVTAVTSAAVPANPLPADRVAVGRELLLGAQDSLGRRYFTRIRLL